MSRDNLKRTIRMDINVEEICRMRQDGMTNKQIANALGVSVSSIYRYAGRMSEAVKHAEVQNKPCPIPDPIKFTPVEKEEPKPEPVELDLPKKEEHFSFTTDRFGNVVSISPRNAMDEKLSLLSKTLVDLEETKKEVQKAQENQTPQMSGKERRRLEREKRKQEEREKRKQEEAKMEGMDIVEEAKKKATDDIARQILADIAGTTVNDSTNSLTKKIIFDQVHKPQPEPSLFEVLSTRTVLKGSLCNWIVDTESGSIEMTDGVLSGLLDKDSLKRYMDELNAVAKMLGVQ